MTSISHHEMFNTDVVDDNYGDNDELEDIILDVSKKKIDITLTLKITKRLIEKSESPITIY